VIDLHSHVLPGLDDGAADLAEAVSICRAASADGVTTLAATPHVRDDHPTRPEEMERLLEELRAAVGGAIALLPGGEVALEELDRPEEELLRFALAGIPEYLLVETPYLGWPLDIADRLFRLRAAGVTPVLAHPERNAELQRRPELVEPLVATGTLVQLTAASVDGRLGDRAARCARVLIERGSAHLIASDAHAPSVRAIGMRAAADALEDPELARWLTVDVPGAIVARSRLPERPETSKRRRRWR
jgi:protein-tyrosine phosphatase